MLSRFAAGIAANGWTYSPAKKSQTAKAFEKKRAARITPSCISV